MRLVNLPLFCTACRKNVEWIPESKDYLKARCGCGSRSVHLQQFAVDFFPPLDSINTIDKGGIASGMEDF